VTRLEHEITWTWLEGGITAEDDREAPAAKSQVAPEPMPMPMR